MTTNDDFWGNSADWPELPQGERREPRARVGATVSRWWSSVVGGASTAHREHGGSESVASTSPDAEDAPIPANSTAEIPATRLVARPGPEDHVPVDSVESADPDAWDFDWEVASAEPKPGVDPLIARIGGAAIVLTLLVPVFLGLGSGDDEPAVDAALVQPLITLVPPAAETDPASTAIVGPTATTASPTATAATSAPASTASATPSTTPATTPATTRAPAGTSPATAADAPAPTSGTTITSGALASGTAERIEQNCAIDYTIVAGDFWIRLADAADVPIAQLLEANDATSDTALYPGTTICLPAGAEMPSAPTSTTPTSVAAPVTTSRPASTTPTAPSTAQPSPPTTVAPVVTYPTPPAAVVQQIIRDIWPDELEGRAIEIADRESDFVATARNSCCYGVFQIYFSAHRSWLDDLGVTSAEQLFDVKTNVLAAYVLYQRSGGWGPWT